MSLNSGGSGAPPGRHYDRSAKSSLNRSAATRFGKRGPELRRRPSAKVAAFGAPEGVVSRSQGAPPRARRTRLCRGAFRRSTPPCSRGKRLRRARAAKNRADVARRLHIRRRAQSATVAPGKSPRARIYPSLLGANRRSNFLRGANRYSRGLRHLWLALSDQSATKSPSKSVR